MMESLDGNGGYFDHEMAQLLQCQSPSKIDYR